MVDHNTSIPKVGRVGRRRGRGLGVGWGGEVNSFMLHHKELGFFRASSTFASRGFQSGVRPLRGQGFNNCAAKEKEEKKRK